MEISANNKEDIIRENEIVKQQQADNEKERIANPQYISPLSVRKRGLKMSMSKYIPIHTFSFIFSIVVYLEITFRIFTFQYFDKKMIYAVMGAIMYSTVISIICTISQSKLINSIISIFILFITEIWFISEFVYYKLIGEIYIFSDFENFGKISGYMMDILQILYENIFVIVGFLLPIFGLLFVRIFSRSLFERILIIEYGKLQKEIVLLSILIISYITIILGIQFSDNAKSSYTENNSNCTKRAEDLGLITSERLEIKWMIFD